MRIDGGCHCGAITYEAEVDPDKTSICHCTDCQQLTGTAFRVTVLAPEDKYEVTKGTPKVYIKLGESGAKRAQAFCPECGSHLYATSVGDGPKIYGIRVGTAKQRDKLVPRTQKWHRSALHWLPEFEDMPATEKQ
ncbi:aldehyde-activating protein [Mesorhizobium sp. Root554]|uniref:GFA family protein n=1 Tax=unclassified Mesorhizobium TaxID=325217 RepID=UPI0006FD92BC|nr:MULTISPECIES: GFA family protein [unclassified Mesorhizobium]KQZ15435.1 aldehyde-activating protein [Mesorhizobium sp. Root1471]KQZ37944.1 aldehyde-activating protein [Mesorhizobium sp. Root554]